MRLTVDTKNLPSEQTNIEWVLCSMHFEDTVLIAPEMLNDTPLTKHTKKYQLNKSKKSTLTMHIIIVGLVATKKTVLLVYFVS